MEPKISNFTPVSPGNVTISGIPFMPRIIHFYVAQRPTTDNVSHYSYGCMTSSKQMTHSTFFDSTPPGKTVSSFSKCVSHLNRVSGVITETVSATRVSFNDNGGGDYGFTLNFSAADGTRVYFVAEP